MTTDITSIKLIAALAVLVLTPWNRIWLERNDPMGLAQADEALVSAGLGDDLDIARDVVLATKAAEQLV